MNGPIFFFFLSQAFLSLLDHPSIVRLYEMRERDDVVYLIMEYFEGNELFFMISRKVEHAQCLAVGNRPNDGGIGVCVCERERDTQRREKVRERESEHNEQRERSKVYAKCERRRVAQYLERI